MEMIETVCTSPGKSCFGIASTYENFDYFIKYIIATAESLNLEIKEI